MFDEEEKPKVQKGGSQFADVSQYLSANQPQAKRLASQVGQGVVNAGNQARQSAGAVQQKFNENVQTNTVPYNQGVAQKAMQDQRSFFQGYQPIQQAPQNTKDWQAMRKQTNQQIGGGGKFGNLSHYLSQGGKQPIPVVPPSPITPTNTDDIAAFQAMQSGEYAGPQSLAEDAGYADALAREQEAAKMTANLGTEVGRQDLLSGLYEGGRGGSALDQLLLGGSDAQGILGNVATQNADIPGALEGANEQSIATADTAEATNAATRDKFNQEIGGSLQGLQDQQAQLANQRGGGWKRAQRQTQQMDIQQRLDALNRLMGTGG